MMEICPLISVFWCQFFTFTDQLEDCRQKTASLRVEWKTLMMNSSHLLSINDCLRKENGKKYICNIQLASCRGVEKFHTFLSVYWDWHNDGNTCLPPMTRQLSWFWGFPLWKALDWKFGQKLLWYWLLWFLKS